MTDEERDRMSAEIAQRDREIADLRAQCCRQATAIRFLSIAVRDVAESLGKTADLVAGADRSDDDRTRVAVPRRHAPDLTGRLGPAPVASTADVVGARRVAIRAVADAHESLANAYEQAAKALETP